MSIQLHELNSLSPKAVRLYIQEKDLITQPMFPGALFGFFCAAESKVLSVPSICFAICRHITCYHSGFNRRSFH